MFQRREKLFGAGRPVPLDRNQKARILTLGRALMRRTQKGRAYGVVSAKAFAVLSALLYQFHNSRSGLCFPSYETIAEAAGCARSTVAEAVKALEAAGLISWVNRLRRVREVGPGLFGNAANGRLRVVRTSNGYRFNDPISSKSDFPTGTDNQVFLYPTGTASMVPAGAGPAGFKLVEGRVAVDAPPNALEAALQRLGANVRAAKV